MLQGTFLGVKVLYILVRLFYCIAVHIFGCRNVGDSPPLLQLVPEQEYRLDDAIEDICQKSVWLKNPGRYQVIRADRVDLESAVRE